MVQLSKQFLMLELSNFKKMRIAFFKEMYTKRIVNWPGDDFV